MAEKKKVAPKPAPAKKAGKPAAKPVAKKSPAKKSAAPKKKSLLGRLLGKYQRGVPNPSFQEAPVTPHRGFLLPVHICVHMWKSIRIPVMLLR